MGRYLLIVLLLAATPRVVGATIIVAVPEAELVARADTIVVGSVIRTWTAISDRGIVTTRASVQVYRALRGATIGEVLTLQVPGGKLKGHVAFTPGSPTPQPGQLVFAFLQDAGDVRLPLGLSYGLLHVRTAADGSYRVFREADGLTMVDRTGQPVPASQTQLRDVPLDQLIGRVQKRLIELGVPPVQEVRP